MKKKEVPIEEIIEKRKRGTILKDLAQEHNASQSTISKRINKYYKEKGEEKPDFKVQLSIEENRVLKSQSVLVQYLKKGLTPEQIQEVAQNSRIIIPQSLMDSAIAKVEGQKTIQSEEERDK